MKPTNISEPGCNFSTSNCVIWQGENIPCINLCNGDTVSEVVHKLASELCYVLETLKITSYDLSCFNLTQCKPANFQQLVQFIIENICAIEKCTGCIPDCTGVIPNPSTQVSTPIVSPSAPQDVARINNAVTVGCPDCTVNIAPCFYYQDATGDIITTMQLTDYATSIGNLICSHSATIATQQLINTNVNNRLTVVEAKVANPPVVVLPTITPTCVLPAESTSMVTVLTALEQQFCQLVSATGSPNQVYTGMQLMCPGINNERTLSNSTITYGSLPGWTTNPSNLGQTIGDMWLVLCDIIAATRNIEANLPTGCSGVSINMTASITGTNVTIYLTGIIPPRFTNCSSGGSLFTITDTFNNSVTFPIDIIGTLNNISGYTYNLASTSVNPSVNLIISSIACINNISTNATCQNVLNYTIINTAICPSIIFTTTQTSIAYSFTSSAGTKTYTIQLWNEDNSVNLQSQIINSSTIASQSGTFSSLTAGINYNIRVVVTVGTVTTDCAFQAIATNPPACIPPTLSSAVIIVTG